MTQTVQTPECEQPVAAPRRSGPPEAYRRSSGAQIRFAVVAVILIASAAGMQALARLMQGYFTKEPISLKKPFSEFDKYKLGPEFSRHADTDRLPPLSEDMVASLGTSEYATWILTDNERADSPLGRATVFVTYYTGKPDMVPHVPDECMRSGGWDRVWGPEHVQMTVPGAGAPNDKIEVRVQTFQEQSSMMRTGQTTRQSTVGYFFHTNGQFATTRNEVRRSQMNLRDRYAYYAKIQVDIVHLPLAEGDERADEIAAIERVLRKVMPILVKDHLPDWPGG
ncbi:MAG: hypothetical protein JNG88_02755 [Phycisphaerales bacterium]|nr:hypothetical protein [Phycisphaerales bacterium]